MTLLWYHWAVFGVLLVLGELAVPAFVLLWFGLGALGVAGIMALAPEASFVVQLLLWVALSVALVVLWFKVFEPQRNKSFSGQASAGVLGETGLLVSDIEPFGKAKVRFQTPLLGADVWECVADEKIGAGSRVKVISVEGSLLKIAPSGDKS
ncbi:MAG: NfeD family protein [Alphaproteobacteria bacterium]|nr:NfeD family protein [Alphaproteobacteria bacterium]